MALLKGSSTETAAKSRIRRQIDKRKHKHRIKTPENSQIQIVLKLKTVFGGKGQIQTITEIQTEIKEEPKPNNCSLLNYELRRLIHQN